jgi:hypothetical protein
MLRRLQITGIVAATMMVSSAYAGTSISEGSPSGGGNGKHDPQTAEATAEGAHAQVYTKNSDSGSRVAVQVSGGGVTRTVDARNSK